MTDIPDEIMERAREAAITNKTPSKFAKDVRAGKLDDHFPIPSIARALMAERDRALEEAATAETYPPYPPYPLYPRRGEADE